MSMRKRLVWVLCLAVVAGAAWLGSRSTGAKEKPAWTEVRMDVVGGNGQVLFSLSSYAGLPAATGYAYLQSGNYTVRYLAIAPRSGPLFRSVRFALFGQVASDPIGPGYTGGSGDDDDDGHHGGPRPDHWGNRRDRVIAMPVWDQPYYF